MRLFFALRSDLREAEHALPSLAAHSWRESEPRRPFFKPYHPLLDGIVGRAGPGFDGVRRCRLLLVGTAERHSSQHAPSTSSREIIETAKLIAQLGLADLYDERRRIWPPRRDRP